MVHRTTVAPSESSVINESSMTKRPIRIQRQRTKGWKMPENTVYVGRGSRWGNPFRTSTRYGAQEVVDLYRREMPELTREAARLELAGKNLACWCRPDDPCHADVLLELANQEIP